MTDQPETPPVTPLQCKQWWESVAEWLAEVEARADAYLLDEHMDPTVIAEINDAITAAKVSADTCVGTYYRVAKARLPQAQPQTAQTYTQPARSYG